MMKPNCAKLVEKLRSFDSFGTLKNLTDEEVISKYFFKTKKSFEETFKDLDDRVIFSVRLIFETVAQIIEEKLNKEVNCIVDISREGFGKVAVYSGNRILILKHLRTLQNFGFTEIEQLEDYMDKIIKEGVIGADGV